MIFELQDKEEFKKLNVSSWQENYEFIENDGYLHIGVKEFLLEKIDGYLKNEFSTIPYPKIIDIGFGTGWLNTALEGRKIEYYGVDIVPEFIKHPVTKVSHPSFFKVADVESESKLELPEGQIIVCAFSLIEMPYLERALNNINDLMSPGSRVLIVGLNPLFEIFRDSEDKVKMDLGYKLFRSSGNHLVISKRIKLGKKTSPSNYYRILYDIDDYIKIASAFGWWIEEVFEEVNKETSLVDQPIYNYISFVKP